MRSSVGRRFVSGQGHGARKARPARSRTESSRSPRLGEDVNRLKIHRVIIGQWLAPVAPGKDCGPVRAHWNAPSPSTGFLIACLHPRQVWSIDARYSQHERQNARGPHIREPQRLVATKALAQQRLGWLPIRHLRGQRNF